MNDGITADHYIAALESRIRDLEAKLAAAEADAGRYRWLRDNQHDSRCPFYDSNEYYPGEKLDQAIDAASCGK